MRTRLSVCNRKARFATKAEAVAAGAEAPFALLPYRCDRCRMFHLTSRMKGKWVGARQALSAKAGDATG